MAELAVAERLGKTLNQLREVMTAEELLLWMLYFDVKQDREREALEKAKVSITASVDLFYLTPLDANQN